MRTALAIGCLIALPLFVAPTANAASNRTKVWNDATRLAALLDDAQNKSANFSPATWKSFANESNMLANRLYAQSGHRAAARDARTHVREMREAALKGDADGARSHAGMALPFVYQLIDWAAPKE